MRLRDFIQTIAEGYDRSAGLRTETQALLRRASAELAGHAPAGFVVKGSGGKGTATLTPWVGFFDPDETTSPEEGLYVVYIFAADLGSVTLILLQGITKLDRLLGHSQARTRLADDAIRIRSGLPATMAAGLSGSVDLATAGFRQRAYAAACVLAKRYEMSALPLEDVLRADFDLMLDLYQEAMMVKSQAVLARDVTTTQAHVSSGKAKRLDPLAHFRPKDDSDYRAMVEGGLLIKSRRHEGLIAEYGEWAGVRRFAPSTNEHPKDLVLRRGTEEWLVEAKVVRRGNATDAVRAAVGQLLQYRHFLYSHTPVGGVGLVGLFSEPVGDAYVQFLESIGIASVWQEGLCWYGSADAHRCGLCDPQ